MDPEFRELRQVMFLKPYAVLAAALFCGLAPGQSSAEPREPTNSVRLYVFGNSTIFHASSTPTTVVPYWVHKFARAVRHRFAFGGQFGWLQQHASQNPTAQWGVQGVPGAWDSDAQPFGAADFDSVMITTANFMQSESPTEKFYDQPKSPVAFTLDIIDRAVAAEPGVEFFLYQNWPELAAFMSSDDFPPGADEVAQFNDFTLGGFHDWWVDYHAALTEARPGVKIHLIPVGSVLARMFTETELSALTAADLYEDSAPHGTGTLYFLASMVTYTGLYGQLPPAKLRIPGSVHPLVQKNYTQILDFIAADLPNW